MCYDMSFYSNIKLVSDYLPEAMPLTFDFGPTYHQVAQSFCPWPVALREDGIKVKLFEWGLISDYMNTPEIIKKQRNSMANARSEKVIGDQNSYWFRIRRQRCIAFTNGFFEHQEVGMKKKIPYFIKSHDEPLFAIAALYNYSPDFQTGEAKGSFAVITRSANSLLKTIHNGGPNAGRMPLILNKALAIRWLDPSLSDAEMQQILDFEMPSTSLDAWPVKSIRVKKEDNESVIEPVEYGLQQSLL